MASGLIDIIKMAASDAVENSKPCDIRYGTVTSTSPLKISVTNQFILPAEVLIVAKHLTDHTVDITETGEPRKTVTVHGALQVNDKVVLLRQSGGQFYFVIDRI